MTKERVNHKTADEKEIIQWHPAFYCAIQLEFREDAEYLEFSEEFNLTEKPLAIDMVIVKKKDGVQVKNCLGHIFKRHNIIEYKSPDDHLDIDVFYKTIAYACLYKALPKHVDEISAEELTITIVRDTCPVKLLRKLEKSGFKVEKKQAGIYYISRNLFDTQIIAADQLAEDEQVWLRSLTKRLTPAQYKNVVKQSEQLAERERQLAEAVIQVMTKANVEKIDNWKERVGMYWKDTLREIMADDIEEIKREAVAEAVAEVTEKAAEKAAVEAAKAREEVKTEAEKGEKRGKVRGINALSNAILLAREKQYTTVDELLAVGIEREVAEAAVKLL